MSKRRGALASATAAFALGLGACGGDDGGNGDQATPAEQAPPATTAAPEASEPITIQLVEENKSGQSGTATLIPGKVGTIETFEIRLEVKPTLRSAQMAHVHNVTCAEYAKVKDLNKQIATVHSSLADVANGKSKSTSVPGSIAEGGYSINVHKPKPPFPATLCGDIPQQ